MALSWAAVYGVGSQRGALRALFAPTQLPLAAIEGIFDRSGGELGLGCARPELERSALKEGLRKSEQEYKTVLALLAAVLVLAVVPFFLAPARSSAAAR